jgi:hypothetical protein
LNGSAPNTPPCASRSRNATPQKSPC